MLDMQGDLIGFLKAPISLAELGIHEAIGVIPLVLFPKEHQSYMLPLHLAEDVIQIRLRSRSSRFCGRINQELFIVKITGPRDFSVLSSFENVVHC